MNFMHLVGNFPAVLTGCLSSDMQSLKLMKELEASERHGEMLVA